MTEFEKMMTGGLYRCDDEILEKLTRARELCRKYNLTGEYDQDERKAILKELLGVCPENISVFPDLHMDVGANTSIGENFFANYGTVILDVNKVTIGRDVMFGPRVCVFTAGHPTDAEIRRDLLEYGYPVTIGDDVWVGGNTVINPGVTVGSRTVIGSGSVVTKDIPSDVLAAGNPCRVIRKLDEKDREKWQAQKREWENN